MAPNNAPLDFACSCGQIQGHITPQAVQTGTHTACYCRDCRAAELYFDQPDPAPGPVDLFQTTPDTLTIAKGTDLLGLLRLSPRGTMRWYATCCNLPMFNTTPRAKLAFVGLKVAILAEPDRVGPVVAKSFIPGVGGKTSHKGIVPVVFSILTKMLAARLSGNWRQTPFFDETGAPVAKATIPSKKDRAALYPR
ncbi:MAG: DUF6151 family protein [Rhodobacteraceae bacterium]|nr:DUF6151 family protein [Paracoccaceae bacterium]